MIYQANTIDKDHGRLEEREIFVLATHETGLQIPGIKQIALLNRKREILKTGSKNEDNVLLITNLDHQQLDAKALMDLKRSYWWIENKLHYRKDFTFAEDRSTIRKKHGPQNMATLRNFAIGFLMANNIANVKRCVENLQHDQFALFKNAA